MTIKAGEVPADRWAQLGRALRERRIGLGYPSLMGFHEAVSGRERGVLSYRILRDLEAGVPRPYTDNTLIRLERLYQLPGGAVEDYLRSLDHVPALAVLPPAERPAPPAPADLLGQMGITPEDLRATVRTLAALEDLTGRRRAG
jgi:hypothetical protein